MMEGIVRTLAQLNSAPELEILCKATLILAVALALVRFSSKRAACHRHLILAASFGAVLVVPLIVFFGPRFGLRVPAAASVVSVATPSIEAASSGATHPRPMNSRESNPNEAMAVVAGRLSSWRSLLGWVWIVGSSSMLLILAFELWRLRRLCRDGLPNARLDARFQLLAWQHRVRRRTRLLTHPDLAGPVTCGFVSPVILLPEDAEMWNEEDFRRAIVHELEHVRRGDWFIHLMGRAATALYWFHPLAWTAWRQLSLEAERACDDAVLQREEKTEYAEQLVSLARRMHQSSVPAIGMARRTDLAARVRAVLDPNQKRGFANGPAALAAVASAILVVALLGPVHASAQNPVSGGPGSALNEALFNAAELGEVPAIERLLIAGADVNAKLGGDGSPLIAAARGGHDAAVKVLLDRGADPNLAVQGDGSPLIMAALRRHLSTVRLLLERGADIHMPVPQDGNPLIMAARGGSVEVVEFLLNRGANIEQVVPGDENALIEASASGHLPVVKVLVGRGANINARVWAESANGSGEWRTPLSMARRNNRTPVVEYLLSVGARD